MAKKEATEFEAARKKRQTKIALQRLRTLIIVIIVSAAVVAGIYFTVSEDLLGILSDRISASQSSSASMPFGISGKSVRDTFELNGNIAIITDSTFYLYSGDGARLLSVLHGMVNPVGQTSGRKVLLFDQGGKNLILRTRDKAVFENTFESNIVNAEINAGGWMAVITEAQRYASKLYVYDEGCDEVFTWSASDDYIVTASVSPDGKYVAAASLTANDYGEMETDVRIFSLATGEKVAERRISDAAAVDITYRKDGDIKLLLDCEAALMDPSLEILSAYYFTETPASYSNGYDNDGMVLVFDRYKEARSTSLIFLGADMKERKNVSVYGKYSISHSGEKEYLLFLNASLYVFGYDGSQRDNFPWNGDPLRIMSVDGNVYAVTRQEFMPVTREESKEEA